MEGRGAVYLYLEIELEKETERQRERERRKFNIYLSINLHVLHIGMARVFKTRFMQIKLHFDYLLVSPSPRRYTLVWQISENEQCNMFTAFVARYPKYSEKAIQLDGHEKSGRLICKRR